MKPMTTEEIKEAIDNLRTGFNPTTVSILLDSMLEKIKELEDKLAKHTSRWNAHEW